MVVDDHVAIVGDGVFCFLLLLLLPVDGDGDGDGVDEDEDEDDEDFDCNCDDLKFGNIPVIDGGMDRGDDVCGCCGDIMVGSNKTSSNDCTTSASNADGNDSDE